MNLVILIGRLGRDPELRSTKGGMAVCSLRVATDFRREGSEPRTDWHDIVVWGDSAKACSQYLSSGRMVAIQGRIQTRAWEDENGQKKWRTEIIANRVDFLSGASDQQASQSASPALPF